jgi:hypothetical protein
MVSSGLLRRVALVRTDVSEEPGASFIRVTNNPEDTILHSHRRENLKSYMVSKMYAHIKRLASSGMLRRVALVRTDVSEELSASFIRVSRIELGATLAVTSNRPTLHS